MAVAVVEEEEGKEDCGGEGGERGLQLYFSFSKPFTLRSSLQAIISSGSFSLWNFRHLLNTILCCAYSAAKLLR